MAEMGLSEDKVMIKLEELALKPVLTEEERKQLDVLLKACKVKADNWIAETDREIKNYSAETEARHKRFEEAVKRRELAEAKKERKITIGLKIFEVGFPLFITCCLFGAGLSFETNQSFTSRTAQTIKSLLTLGR